MKITLFMKLIPALASLAVLPAIIAGCQNSIGTSSTSSSSTPTNQSQHPVEVISMTGPLQPINPGGPVVEIVLQNAGVESIVALKAKLTLNKSFDFNFSVSTTSPLLPGTRISSKQTLVMGGFDSSLAYPLEIIGSLGNGGTFDYTESIEIVAPTSAPTSTATAAETTATAVNENGLSLTISIGSATYHPSEQISITIDEKNTLTTGNKLDAAKKWPIAGLNLGPCDTLNYSFGISIMQGNYSATNFASGRQLLLYNPNAIYNCPMMLAGITSYDFQPVSDNAEIYANHDSAPFPISMTTAVNSTGYWSSGADSTFSNFTPGIYTVVGGDEWGTVVLLHLVVS